MAERETRPSLPYPTGPAKEKYINAWLPTQEVKPWWQSIHQEENGSKASVQTTRRQSIHKKGHHAHGGAQAIRRQSICPNSNDGKASVKEE
jgi:hypothetical protein